MRDLADSQINKRTTKWAQTCTKVGNKYEKKEVKKSGKHYKDSNNRNNR
jgi:hypothetical protein